MAEEQKVEQAVENTNQEVSAEQIVEQQKKVEGAEIDDLREALKKSDCNDKSNLANGFVKYDFKLKPNAKKIFTRHSFLW